jgi:hypothetical protein
LCGERRDPEFDAQMVGVLHVYKEVEIWRQKGSPPPDLVAALSYDELFQNHYASTVL